MASQFVIQSFGIGRDASGAEWVQAAVKSGNNLFIYRPDRDSALRPKPKTPYFVKTVRKIESYFVKTHGIKVSVYTVDVLRDATAALEAKKRRERMKAVEAARLLPPNERRKAIAARMTATSSSQLSM